MSLNGWYATAEEKRLKRLRAIHRLNTYFICASSFNGRDSCLGDSGGPFSIQGRIVQGVPCPRGLGFVDYDLGCSTSLLGQ